MLLLVVVVLLWFGIVIVMGIMITVVGLIGCNCSGRGICMLNLCLYVCMHLLKQKHEVIIIFTRLESPAA